MKAIKYAYAEVVQEETPVYKRSCDIAPYKENIYRVLIYSDALEDLSKYKVLEKKYEIFVCKKNGWHSIELFERVQKEEKTVHEEMLSTINEDPITHVKNILREYWITNAMTLYVDESGNRRRKSVLTKIIGRSTLKKIFSKPIKNNCLTQEETRELCKLLWRDIQSDLLNYFQKKGVTTSLELLVYRQWFTWGCFINQNYINELLLDDKPEGHISLFRSLQCIKWLWRDIYDDIITYASKQKRTVTESILMYFQWNNNPLDEMSHSISQEQQKFFKKKILDELIKDIQMAWIPRSLFKIMGRERLQNQLAGKNLYRRLYMVLWKPVGQITTKVRREILELWKEYDG
jgi:hypothetical protein